MADIDANCKLFDKKYMKKGQGSVPYISSFIHCFLMFHFAYIVITKIHIDSNQTAKQTEYTIGMQINGINFPLEIYIRLKRFFYFFGILLQPQKNKLNKIKEFEKFSSSFLFDERKIYVSEVMTTTQLVGRQDEISI